MMGCGATIGGTPSRSLALLVAGLLLATACARGRSDPDAGIEQHVLPVAAAEPHCAWFGASDGARLYYGIAPFWPAYRSAGNDPSADLRRSGPQLLGRFDLATRRHLPPIRVAPGPEPTGVWDVLPSADGRLFFTTFFGSAGVIDLATGAVTRFDAVGPGLNELAPGPEGSVFATRYFGAPDGGGSVVQIDPAGRVLLEAPLAAAPDSSAAGKSLAWDPVRDEIWVNTDLFRPGGAPVGHDARVLGPDGRERLRFESPELHFVHFAADGTGTLALVDGETLSLRIRPPGAAGLAGRSVVLDEAFPPAFDFVQDIQPAPSGAIVVTRWSGRVHIVSGSDRVHTLQLPALADGGLYYTAVIHGDQLCATACDGIRVVCRSLAGP